MAKFYVSCLGIKEAVSAETPVEACAKVWDRLGCATAGINWRVSERGYSWHMEDVLVDDLLIIRYLIKKYEDGE